MKIMGPVIIGFIASPLFLASQANASDLYSQIGYNTNLSFSNSSSIETTNTLVHSEPIDLQEIVGDSLNGLVGRNVFNLKPLVGSDRRINDSTDRAHFGYTLNDRDSNGIVAGVSISKVAGAIETGAGTLVLSLLASGLITLAYMGYTKTGLFKKRDALALIKKGSANANKFNFAR